MNLSKAFAHWYLENTLKMDEQSIAEAIIDGNGDNGFSQPALDAFENESEDIKDATGNEIQYSLI